MPLDPSAFDERADPALLTEWMDEPCTYDDLRQCLLDLEQVNFFTLAHRATIAWLGDIVRGMERSEPLHVMDVGCGGGDMLRKVAGWAKRRGVRVRLTGVDLNPQAIAIARDRTPQQLDIEWIAGDVYQHTPVDGVDVVISALMTHHMADDQIVKFLQWMEASTRRGWFVNDLYRSARAHQLFGLLAGAMRWHRFVRHDGPVSILRGFREADWVRLCSAAGICESDVRIEKVFPSRLCVSRTK